MITFFDLETTGLDPMQADILTGCFKTTNASRDTVDTLYIELRPDHWSEQAAQVHGISYEKAMQFEEKRLGLRKIFRYLSKYPGVWVCHANYRNFNFNTKQLGHYYFDWAMLKHQWTRVGKYHDFCAKYENGTHTIESTHTLAKKIGIKGKLNLKALASRYDLEFEHHNCQEDVRVTEHIYFELLKEQENRL